LRADRQHDPSEQRVREASLRAQRKRGARNDDRSDPHVATDAVPKRVDFGIQVVENRPPKIGHDELRNARAAERHQSEEAAGMRGNTESDRVEQREQLWRCEHQSDDERDGTQRQVAHRAEQRRL